MAKTSKKAKRTPSAAFMKPVTPDDKLAKVVGDKPLPRTELTKKLWAYIRKHGLQSAAEPDLDSTRMAVQRFSVDFMDRSVEPGVDFDRFAAGT
jgi:chromatin remodeling complex protein RSC6